MAKKQLDITMERCLLKPFLYCACWVLFLIIPLTLCGQNSEKKPALTEPGKVQILIATAENELQQQRPEKALLHAKEAYSLSVKQNNIPGKAESLGLMGKANRFMKQHTDALKFYLWAIKTFEVTNNQIKIASCYWEIGLLYIDMQAYKKAEDYFLLYEKIKQKEGASISSDLDFMRNMAFVYLRQQEYDQAFYYYALISEVYANTKDTLNLLETYQTLSYISKLQQDYEKAISFNNRLLEVYQQQNDVVKISNTYNNIGFLYKKSGNLKAALESFNNGIVLAQKYAEGKEEESQIALFTNIGIAYTNFSLFLKAKEYYLQALKLEEKQKDVVGEAQVHNHLASNYLVSGKSSLALKEVMTAVDIGITYDAKEVLATSYKILSLIYEADNNPSKALLYQNKHTEITSLLEEKESAKAKEILQRQVEIEKKEDELKVFLLEQEQNALEKERKENELILKEKELAILKQDQKLKSIALQNQQLEKEKAEQALALTLQQLQAEKKNIALKEMEKQRELQDLMLKQQSLEKQQQEKTIALLEADQMLKEQKIHEQILFRKYAYGIIGLVLMTLGITFFSFKQKQKDNKKLQKHQIVIQEKNKQLLIGEKELRKNMVALQTTQTNLARQKRALEVENKKTQESIEYAKRIQFSILPGETQRRSIISDSFVLYRPKDIVSGDFYWISQKNEKIFVSVIDCTGHGVPGALVSLIGNNVLNEAINEQHLEDPAEILQYMDYKVRIQLKQEEGDINDGMDLGLCVLEPIGGNKVHINFGGAKNTLFLVKDGELLTIKGDRKSIGGVKSVSQFTKKSLVVSKGDIIYLTTDGYIDQANPKRERFGSKKFKALIEDIHYIKMVDQKAVFEQALDDHQQDAEQRDDINLIGVRI